MNLLPTNKFAYVMLCMRGDAYAPGAIAMAESIRLSGSPHDIVCMCTPDVSEAARMNIATTARVVSVDYVRYQCKPMLTARQNELYASWLNESFTKWRCLELDEYEKILFVDADMLVINNVDHLFQLQAPAATFSSPWAREYCAESTFSLRGYPRVHAARVPAAAIRDTIRRGWGYLAIASMVLLTPNRLDFTAMCAEIEATQPYGLGTLSTPDEESIVNYYASRGQSWTMIHQRYNAIVHKVKWLKTRSGVAVPSVLHYFSSTKPWQNQNDFNESPFPTDPLWWYVLRQWWKRTACRLPIALFDKMIASDRIKIKNSEMVQEIFPWIVAARVPFPELF